tara:strand:- start:115 stop:441 length:327 start_codon:yes stop_codon:yes gene_type:complete
MKKLLMSVFFIIIAFNAQAAQTQIAQVNGMMCIKCQKMVTKALQKASPDAEIKVSWPEGVAVSAFKDKSNLSDDEYKNAIAGTGFEVIKVVSVDKIVTDAGEAVKILD